MTADDYDAIPYESTPFAETHPARLACLARLYGIEAPDPRNARVLEIGCANGGNLIPLAARLPEARFTGIELSAAQALDGQQRVQRLGLDNCEIVRADLVDFEAPPGSFDYILAHGVYSWVPEPVAQRLLAQCRHLLSEQGIAYISYNTLPGWRYKGALRDMLHDSVGQLQFPAQKLRAAQEYLTFLQAALDAQDSIHAGLLMQQIARIQEAHPSYLFHEYLEPHNRPSMFRDFVREAAAHGLDYVSDIELSYQFPSYLGEQAEALLQRIEDPFECWQQIDNLVNRAFRQSLLCRAEARPAREPDIERLREFAWLADVHIEDGRIIDATGEPIEVEHPLSMAALQLLGDRYPMPLPFEELHARALLHLAAAGIAVDSRAAALADWLEEWFSLYALGSIQALPSDMAPSLPNEPLHMDALARLWVGLGERQVAGLHHASLALDPFAARVVGYLDGSRAPEALLQQLLADLAPGGALGWTDARQPAPTREQVEFNLARLLALFRRHGLVG